MRLIIPSDGRGVSRRHVLFAVSSLLAGARRLRGEPDTKFATDVKVVNVLATVRDKQGNIVRNLTQNDFTLSEDGRPQTIRYFAQQTDLPLTLGLLVDTSMSQRRLIETERGASYSFFDQVLREDKDMAFVIHFDHEVELLQDLTSSRKQLEKALELLKTPEQGGQRRRPQGGGYPGGGGRYPQGGRGRGTGTALYDSVLLASDELMKKQSGRKADILLTDGVDMGSRVSISTAIEAAQRADTLVYSIRFYDDQAYGSPRGGYGRYGGRRGRPMPMPRGDVPDGKKVLERLSKETGGGYFEVSKKHSIGDIYRQIQDELRNQYSIGYTSDKPGGNGEFRRIQLAVRQKGLIVQARDGYYAGAQPAGTSASPGSSTGPLPERSQR
jgi:VWFA-related protein